MDLLREAEVALCPANEPNTEVPNGAAGHYLLGLIYSQRDYFHFDLLRYTDRRESAIHHFMQALSIDPSLWVAFEELCILGAAEANGVFGAAAALHFQQQNLHCDLNCRNLHTVVEDCSLPPSRTLGSDDASMRQSKQLHMNNLRDIPGHPHGAVVPAGTVAQPANCGQNISLYNTPSPMTVQMSGVAPPPLNRNMQPNLSTQGAEGSPRSTVNAAIQAPRRKLMDEGKLRKSLRSSSARAANSQVSGRLFADSAPRRSTRLSGEAAANANSNALQIGGNGTNHSSTKFLGGFPSSSKASSAAFRSVTVRKGHSWASESLDEGRRADAFDDARSDNTATTSSTASASGDDRSLEREKSNSQVSGSATTGSRVNAGALELLGLLRTLGEGYRLLCLYRCQEALEAYHKLSHQQYNTGWVLSQVILLIQSVLLIVGKAYFELVAYFEADRAFCLARRVSPHTLEGMDIHSTVLFVSCFCASAILGFKCHLKEEMKLSYLAENLISTDRLSPQAWYVLETSLGVSILRFYSLGVCGYTALEDYENGIKCYQSALRIDARHYNAWYGLGIVYLRQEKSEFAEHHFRKAFQINPRSSVIMCYLGMALHALKRSEEALEMMEKAILADQKNPLPMYQKANILMSLEKLDEALEVLEELKEYVPRESSVWALMGKIYKRLGMHGKAMFHFGLALDLKPSAADVATIKSAIEKLQVPEEIEDNL
ncbi:hypothetical protein ACLOJK_041469 [Asimina triloba]